MPVVANFRSSMGCTGHGGGRKCTQLALGGYTRVWLQPTTAAYDAAMTGPGPTSDSEHVTHFC